MAKAKKIRNISGRSILAARTKKGLTQEDMAAALSVDFNINMDRSAFGRIETGDRGLYDYELLAIAKILEVSPLELLKGKK